MQHATTATLRAISCDERSLGALRIGLGVAIMLEIWDRWGLFDVFYADTGVYPVAELELRGGHIYRAACVHAWTGSPLFVRGVAALQAALGMALALGVRTELVAPVSWYLYFSLTARNCSIAYIADRYLHVFLLLLIFLPCSRAWTFDLRRVVGTTARTTGASAPVAPVASVATALARLQLIWIYVDAGYGKVVDPGGAWSLSATVPALEPMMRYTPVARAIRSVLGAGGLRLLSVSVAWGELCLPTAALLCAACDAQRLQLLCVCAMWAMHIGIALCVNNSALLSAIACVAWLTFVPSVAWGASRAPSPEAIGAATSEQSQPASTVEQKPRVPLAAPRTTIPVRWQQTPRLVLLAAFVVATGYHHLPSFSGTCAADGSQQLMSALLNNRWNAFTAIEEHVTWYIAPARLADGSIVDLWAHGAPLSWDVPTVAPRSGRWKSFAALGTQDAPEAMWRYLCTEWNVAQPASRRVVAYKFFLLSADISFDAAPPADSWRLPPLEHGPPRKRELQAYTCPSHVS